MVESSNQEYEQYNIDSSLLGLLGCDNALIQRLERTPQKTSQVQIALASAYIRVGKFAQAADALDLAEKDDERSLLWVALLRGKINFYLTDFQNAKLCLEEAKALADNHPDGIVSQDAMDQVSVLLNKVNLELSVDKSHGSINQNVYLDAGKVPAAVKQVQNNNAANNQPADQKETQQQQQKPTQQTNTQPATSNQGVINLKYDWYQNGTHAFVSYKITDAGASPNIQVNFLDSKTIKIIHSQKPDEPLVDLSLAHEYIVDGSSFNVTTKKVELKLAKQIQNVNWSSLDQADSVKVPTGPSYPTSSKVKKDWSAIDREIEKDMSKEKPEGDSALNGLFKQIYERSDEETRRAMIKSYQTSGGTVLSTNWGEVASKDYEGKDRPDAPDGQQWAK